MEKFPPREYALPGGQALLLREARGEDARQVLDFLNQVGGESDNLLFGAGEFPLPVEQERAFLERQRGEARSLLLVGFAGEELACVASCDALAARQRTAHRAGLSVTVRQALWGMGIGRRAMEALIDFARGAGLEVLQLEVRADNARALALYERLGFQRLGLYRDFMKVNGQPCDAWFMNLYLDAPVLGPVEEGDLQACLSVIHRSFATVAQAFGLTRENCPTHTSFLPLERLKQGWEEGQLMACLRRPEGIVGCAALARQKDGSFELKHLAVLPEYRCQGCGRRLVGWAEDRARREGAQLLKIGIIHDDRALAAWYEKLGFRQTGTARFAHLPFTVGFMEKPLA